MSATFDHNNAAAHSRPEEVAPDVLVDVLLEEIINNYDLGAFVRRLKAYRTSSGEIVAREEKVQIEDGTKLEMGLFADCVFESYDSKFIVWDETNTHCMEVTRDMVLMKTGDSTTNNVGITNVGSKATGMKFGFNGMASIFNVEGWSIEASSNGSIVSKPPSTMSAGGATRNVIS